MNSVSSTAVFSSYTQNFKHYKYMNTIYQMSESAMRKNRGEQKGCWGVAKT